MLARVFVLVSMVWEAAKQERLVPRLGGMYLSNSGATYHYMYVVVHADRFHQEPMKNTWKVFFMGS